MTWNERKLRFINENVWIGQAVQQCYDSGKAFEDFLLWDAELSQPNIRYRCKHERFVCPECDQ